MRRRFATLDVFTDRRFAGNPLAVVLDGEGLDDAAMQAIAREFNLSETVFVLPPSASQFHAALRIFTPARELPFAGHPTIGTAVLLGLRDGRTGELVLEEGVGPVTCAVEAIAPDRGHATFEVPGEPEDIGDVADIGAVAEALSLTLDDLGCGSLAPAVWSAGVPIAFVPVHGLAAVARARPDPRLWDAAFGPDDPAAVYVFCRETAETDHDFHARMFAPGFGVPEDPATGSAAAAFAGLLARDGGLPDGEHCVAIEQGYEMGRPSVIQLSVSLRDRKLTAAAIAGDAVVVCEGAIEA